MTCTRDPEEESLEPELQTEAAGAGGAGTRKTALGECTIVGGDGNQRHSTTSGAEENLIMLLRLLS